MIKSIEEVCEVKDSPLRMNVMSETEVAGSAVEAGMK